MYLAIVALTMFVLPMVSIVIEHIVHPLAPMIFLLGRWFVFWGVGVRLGLAGLRQMLRPDFTAREIFHMQSDEVLPIVRELGLANLASGAVGLLSVAVPSFVLPVAISATIFYGGAGIRHAMEAGRSRNESIAMISDLFIALVLVAFVIATIAS